jgi:hypothetical protein
MNRKVSLAIALTMAAAVAQNRLTPEESSGGWKLLFDGKTMTGWEQHGDGDWVVKDGALACQGTKPSWLGSDGSYGNYVLKLEFRGAATVNSGVFLRSQKEGQPHITGYELQIWDTQPAGYNTGSLVGTAKASPVKLRGDQWNQYEITASGGHFTIVLNDEKALDTTDGKHAEGVIGFQCQKGHPIEFRNIRLRGL